VDIKDGSRGGSECGCGVLLHNISFPLRN
jgi:hypothetical protein